VTWFGGERNDNMKKYAVSSKSAYSPDFEIIRAVFKNEAKREYQRRHPTLKWREIQASESD
jgi:hypothetical protein